MTDSDPNYTVFNRRNQPLELHVADQVVVVPPLGSTDLLLAAATDPQLVELERRLLVDVRPVAVEEKPAQAPRRRSERKPAGKRRTTRRTTTRPKRRER